MVDEFPHEISIYYSDRVPDGGGGWENKWRLLKEAIAAHVQPISGQQYYFAQQLKNPVDMDVYTPFDPDIKPQMKVVHRGNSMMIEAVLDQGGMDEIMLLKCRRVRDESND